MSRESLGLGPDLQQYLLSVSLRESDALRQCREYTATLPHARMQIAPEQGQFMAFLVKLTNATRVLEVGTYTGYSALAMAQALPPEGRVTTLDIDEEIAAIARRYWAEGGMQDRIELRLGPALQSLQELEGPFDLAFIDADKTNYDAYYERCLELLRPGGVVLLDNVLWGGQVADPAVDDPDTQALRRINRKLHQDGRVDLSMLPVADGITLARKLP